MAHDMYTRRRTVPNRDSLLIELFYEQLNAPLHLSAAVLDGGGAETSSDRALDAGRFIRLCTTHAADCTLALGWVTGRTCRRYNWSDVKAMFELLDRLSTGCCLTLITYTG